MRAPAALTVWGDTVAGAAAAGTPLRGRRMLLPLSSVAFYWAGMAINDWADRELDAVERPERPIPSGRVSPAAALGTGAALTATGLGVAAFAGGRRALRFAAPLAATLWAYDTVLKKTPAGPFGMAACRALDVLLGAPDPGRAAGAAAALGVHTLGVTALSTGEVHGAAPSTARAALTGTAVATAVALGAPVRTPARRIAGLAAGAVYARFVGSAQLAAVRDPSATIVRRATGAGIHGMVPLQSALTARGSLSAAVAVAAALPLARALSRKVSPT
ncbi:4-hydroxybenzoate polyprenyltransferase [Amycolatopsis antarctica]|uniref:4-hydroxybenzoate polyprenyltransferase n=1 Tax=Amycolatopsis antarctica TaxID=1854586 RepID=A0A263D0U2_9PSEU|nr:4-hydroxybenzoate polyprenyltransferase [Amycolatopsis antarctica]